MGKNIDQHTEIRIQVSGTLEVSQKVKLRALQVAYWPIRERDVFNSDNGSVLRVAGIF